MKLFPILKLSVLLILGTGLLASCEIEQEADCQELVEFWDECDNANCDRGQGQAILDRCYGGDRADTLNTETGWLDYKTSWWDYSGSEHVPTSFDEADFPSLGSALPFDLDLTAQVNINLPVEDVESALAEQGFGDRSASLAASAKAFVDKHRNRDRIDAFDDIFMVTTLFEWETSKEGPTPQRVALRVTANRDGTFFLVFHAFGF